MVNQKKTGRLIAKKRKEMKLTQGKLSVLLGVTPQAVSLWERGKRYPDAASQETIHKVMGYNPVELLVGIEMFDDDLKRGIDAHMERIGEEVEVSGIAQDEDGNDVEFDLSDYLVEAGGEDDLRWIPFTDYFNVEPNKDRKPEAPKTPYESSKVYLNMWDSILTIPVEMLVMLGRPDYFNIYRNRKKNTLAIVFHNGEGRDGFDIPQKVYNGKWKGIRVHGGEFGHALCVEMGVRHMIDLLEIVPDINVEKRAIFFPLEEVKRSYADVPGSEFLLPGWQYEELGEEEE